MEGTVVRIRGAYCEVATPVGPFVCTLRGKLRKQLVRPLSFNVRPSVRRVRELKATGPVVVGDRVRVRPLDRETCVVEEVLPRESAVSRAAAGRKPLVQTLLAGLDQLVVVFAVRDPEPHLGLLDRFLVVAESATVQALVVFNKADLGVPDELTRAIAVYRQIGYPVILTSATTGTGLTELRAALAGKTSAFVGPSGVGKTSLLNALVPGLAARVGEVSRATGKGRHTTREVALVPLGEPGGGYVADTPGLRELGFWEVDKEALAEYFPEMRDYLGRCRFPGCAHLGEPDCAVRAAVEAGRIDRRRYQSYMRLRRD